MNVKNLFFHIHYCNYRQSAEGPSRPIDLDRTLDHHELVFIARAKGKFGIGGKSYDLKDGMLLYIRPGLRHTLKTDPSVPGRFYSVHFSYARVNLGEDGWSIQEEPQTLPLEGAQSLKDYYQVEDAFKKLAETWDAKLPGYEFASKVKLQQLLIVIARNRKKARTPYSTSLKVERVIQYMREHLADKIALDELSSVAQLSPTYLSRAFKETTGYSVIEYFNKMKIDKAKEMMMDGHKRIKEVAGVLGYTDEFYFSRLFKKIEGRSPKEFYSKNVHGI